MQGRRGLRLVDAALLIAAVGVGFATLRTRFLLPEVARYFGTLGETPGTVDGLSLRLSGLVQILAPFGESLSLALLAIGLLPPRPRPARLARRPGFVACAAFATVGLAGYGCVLASIAIRGKLTPTDPLMWYAYHGIAGDAMDLVGGWAVASAWLVLILGRRWRPEASWPDRAGRLLGVFWIAVALIRTDALGAYLLRL